MLAVLVMVILLLVSGCSTVNNALQIAASINDSALESAEDVQCNRASIRVVRDKYRTTEQRKAYNMLCGKILTED